jgi:TetR/AcrR family transcriptional regulator, transcriptional repressor for nem operon
MGRIRKFDESIAIPVARAVFAERGYSGTSIDELTARTGMLRGSLYGAFGSKMGLFRACAESILKNLDPNSPDAVNFLVVALKDVGRGDPVIESYCKQHVAALGTNPALTLGEVLLTNIDETR